MKSKIKFGIALFIGLFLFTNVCEAGHWESIRKKCRWWLHKYTANINFALGGVTPLKSHHAFSCYEAKVEDSLSGFNGGKAKGYGRANSSGAEGRIWAAGGAWGGEYPDLIKKLGIFNVPKMNEEDPPILIVDEPTHYVGVLPDFSDSVNKTITLSNIHIDFTQLSTSSYTNSYEIDIWLPQDDTVNYIEDTLISLNKILIYGKVTLYQGNITVSGDLFSVNDFSVVTDEDGIVTLSYIGGSKLYTFSNYQDFDNAAVYSKGDLNETTSILNLSLDETEIKLKSVKESLLLYPNPTTEKLSISYLPKNDCQILISVFNSDGKCVLTEKNEKVFSNINFKQEIDVKTLSPGIYFLLINNGTNKYLKQFSKY
jgi:hypothetical protein